MTREQKPHVEGPKKKLRLTIEVDGIWADDLDECAGYMSEPEPPGPRERLYVVTEEWMRPDVVLTVCTIPGEKCMNDDFEMQALTGRIVGAEAVDGK
jgi:hypothetical protein